MPSKKSRSRKRRSRKRRSYTVKVKCSRKSKKQCKRSPLSCTRDKRAIPGRRNSKPTKRSRCRSRGKKNIARDAARRIQKNFRLSKSKRKSKRKSKSKSKSRGVKYATKNGRQIKVPPRFVTLSGTINKQKKTAYNKWIAKQ